jgi:hypothetical protein
MAVSLPPGAFTFSVRAGSEPDFTVNVAARTLGKQTSSDRMRVVCACKHKVRKFESHVGVGLLFLCNFID